MVCEPTTENMRQARRKYAAGFALHMFIYVVLVFGAALLIRNFDIPQWGRILLSLLPVVPALMMLRTYLTYLASMDEFQRRLQTDSLLVATGIVLFGSFAYGLGEEWADLPHVSLLWVFPIFAFVFGATHAIIRHRYK